jgi:hypothetical protein
MLVSVISLTIVTPGDGLPQYISETISHGKPSLNSLDACDLFSL